MTMEERFSQYVIPVTESGCWLWTGGLVRHGYGAFHLQKNRKVHAHRFAYQLWKGPLDRTMDVDHLCKVKCCVNPDHLEMVTHRENVLRGNARAAHQARQTHCKNGHPLNGNNLIMRGLYRRNCRTCGNAARLAYYHSHRASSRRHE